MSSKNFSSQTLGTILVLLASVGFAGKTILTKLAYRYDVDPLTLLTSRVLMAGVFFLSILIFNLARGSWVIQLSRKEWILVVILGLGGYYLSSYLDFLGLYYIDANLGRMILFLYPTMVVIINAIITRTPISSPTIICLLLCYSGLFMMMWPNLGNPQNNFILGTVYIFFSALTYALYLVGVDYFFRGKSLNFFVSLIFGAASVGVIIHFLLARPLVSIVQPLGFYWVVFLMSSLSTVIPIYALSSGLALVGAPRAAMLSMIGPVVTVFMGVYILDEKIVIIQMFGVMMMIVGVARIK
ncbi:MAG: DMT family transporter [Deltaproteobacteria bacterium]|nr:DMT family transporter [Deltaproteobacteria bacterium]